MRTRRVRACLRSRLGKQDQIAFPEKVSLKDLRFFIIIILVSAAEIIAELPKLSPTERRRLAGAIFDLETDAELLRDCDRRAEERFALLDAMEAEDGKTSAR